MGKEANHSMKDSESEMDAQNKPAGSRTLEAGRGFLSIWTELPPPPEMLP